MANYQLIQVSKWLFCLWWTEIFLVQFYIFLLKASGFIFTSGLMLKTNYSQRGMLHSSKNWNDIRVHLALSQKITNATTPNKAKVKKEQNTVSSNNAKKKPASKNDEVSFLYLYRLKFVYWYTFGQIISTKQLPRDNRRKN